MQDMLEASGARPGCSADDLGRLFKALANPTRVALLHRLALPAFVPELGREFKITRQAVRKHLAALDEAGLVTATTARRGALPATLYSVRASGLVLLRERVRDLASGPDAARPPTRAARDPALAIPPRNHGGAVTRRARKSS